MRTFLRVLEWTFRNDFVEPFIEIVLFIIIFIAASSTFINPGGNTQIFSSLTWNLIYIIVILVGIGGVRSYSLGLERGEVVRQMSSLRLTRSGFLWRKWLSLYLIFASMLLITDAIIFFEDFGFFPNPTLASNWGSFGLLTWVFMVPEQLALLVFLNSLVAILSLVFRNTTVSLLIYFVYTFLGVSLYTVSHLGVASYLQLGYGDYQIVNTASDHYFYLLYQPYNTIGLRVSALNAAFYVGVIYRVVGGLIMLVLAALRFRGMDLD